MLDSLWQDIRYAARLIVKDRGFAAATVATLALCLAGNTAIFSVVNAVILRPLPYPEPERLVTMFNAYPGAGATRGQNGVPDYFDRLNATDVFEQLAVYTWTRVTVGGQRQGDVERILGMTVTPSFFHALGVQPMRGRLFGEADAVFGQQQKVILSDGLWRRLFPGRDDVSGTELRVNGQSYAVVGVLPPSFRFDPDSELWMPTAFTPEDRADSRRHSNNWQMIGRLVPGATLAQAQAQIDGINARNLERFPELKQILINAGFHTPVFLLQDDIVRNTRSIMLLLWGGVVLVLVIGCANVANLASVRGSARSREMATKLSLGTTTWRLARQTLTESLVLSAIGGAAGLLLAGWMLRMIGALGLDALRGKDMALDVQTLGYTFVLVTLAGAIVGLWPALALRRVNLAEIIREEGRSGTPSRRARAMRRLLVTSQVSFALVLLMGAGLLLASFQRVLSVDLGFRPDHLLTGDLNLPAVRYPGQPDMRPPGSTTATGVQAAADRILLEVRRLPGVAAVGLTSSIPLGRNYTDSVILPEGYRTVPGGSLISPSQIRVSEGYFETMGAALAAGRFFDARDTDTAPRAVVVDEQLARRFWPRGDAIGRRLYFPMGVETGLAPPSEDQWLTVVGVVKEMRLQGIASNTGSGVFGTYFLPYPAIPGPHVHARCQNRTRPADRHRQRARCNRTDRPGAAVLRRAVDGHAGRPRARGSTDADVAGRWICNCRSRALRRRHLWRAGVEVRQRTREIAIRMALGADAAAILRLVFVESVVVVAAGAVLGAGGVWLLRRAFESQLYKVSPLDPVVVSAVATVLLVVASLASALPARRAASTHPNTALVDQ